MSLDPRPRLTNGTVAYMAPDTRSVCRHLCWIGRGLKGSQESCGSWTGRHCRRSRNRSAESRPPAHPLVARTVRS